MTSFFDRMFTRYPIKTRRLLEMVPGLSSWTLILFPVWGSLLIPYAVAYFVLFFDVFFAYRSFNLVLTSYKGSKKIKEAEAQNWLEKSRTLADFEKVHHVVVLPNYQESLEKLRTILKTLANQTFPKERVHVILAMEKREKGAVRKARTLLKEYSDDFGSLFPTYHPDILGEVKGKSSNEAWAGKIADKKLVRKALMDGKYTTITTADADSTFDPQYLSYLTYNFLTDDKRYNKFWQSANVDHNNFWSVPAANRIYSFFSSLWRTGLLVQGDRLIATATYSLSFKLLKDIGFWDTDVIPEDYRIFFKAYYKKKGEIWAEPIFLKTGMDAPQSTSYFKSLRNKYHQQRRWSYGTSDDPLFIKWWLTVPNVPFARKTKMLFHVLLDHFLWPVNWFLITISANIITIVNPVFTRSSLGYNLPILARVILTFAIIALMIMIVIDYRNRPKHLGNRGRIREVLFPLEFVIMPIAGFFFSALPSIISHTQIMLGRKMEYKVTEKI
jgi:hypothetical protein